MTIKSLSKEDLEIILDLYNRDFSDGWTENMMLSSFSSGRFLCFGAFTDNQLIGVISVTINFDEADIESVVVSSRMRKKGVASLLINHTISNLREKNIKKIFLEVRKGNIPAINLYKKHGFTDLSVRKKYYFDGEDALVLVKEI